MNAFVVAAVCMVVAALPCLIVVWRGSAMEAVVGYETVGVIAAMVLLLLAEGFQRSSEFEFPILLAVLMLGSGLVYVRFFERWL